MPEKRESRAHERRRRVAAKSNDGGRKIKRNGRNEGAIMRAEVRKYKDAEKIQRGIYAHGSTSGAVRRGKVGLGFSEENKARAENNLSRILALASHQQPLHLTPDSPQPTTTNEATNTKAVSPCRFFLPRKSKKTSVVSDSEGSPKNLKANSSLGSVVSSSESEISDAHRKRVQKTRGDKRVKSSDNDQSVEISVTPERKRSKLLISDTSKTKDQKGTSKSKEKQAGHSGNLEKTRDSSSRKHTSSSKKPGKEISLIQIDDRKIPTQDKSKEMNPKVKMEDCKMLLTRVSNVFRALVKNKIKDPLPEIQARLRERFEETQRRLAALNSPSRNNPRPENKRGTRMIDFKEKIDTSMLRTPSSLDFIRRSHAAGKCQSNLDTTICPGTTISSPGSLLRRYEHKRKKFDDSVSDSESYQFKHKKFDNSVSDSESHLFKRPLPLKYSAKKDYSIVRGETNRNRDSNRQYTQAVGKADKRSLNSSKPLCYSGKGSLSTTPPASQPAPVCPKTVVIDPLHYLERCEKQSSKDEEVEISRRPYIHNRSKCMKRTRERNSNLGDSRVVQIPMPQSDMYNPPKRIDFSNTSTGVRSDVSMLTPQHPFESFGGQRRTNNERSHTSSLSNYASFPSQSQPVSSISSGYHPGYPSEHYIPQREHLTDSHFSVEPTFHKKIHQPTSPVAKSKPLLELSDPVFVREPPANESRYSSSFYLQEPPQSCEKYPANPPLFPAPSPFIKPQPRRQLLPLENLTESDWDSFSFISASQPEYSSNHSTPYPTMKPLPSRQVSSVPVVENERSCEHCKENSSFMFCSQPSYTCSQHRTTPVPPQQPSWFPPPDTQYYRPNFSYDCCMTPKVQSHQRTYQAYPKHNQQPLRRMLIFSND